MLTEYETRNWWGFLLRGVAAIAFAVLVWALPSMRLGTLALLFGIYSIVDALSATAAAYSHPTDDLRDTTVLYATVGVASGLFATLAPDVTAVALVLLIGARALAAGALELIAEPRLRRHVTGEWLLGASGGVSLLFGFLLFLFPTRGALALVPWIGLWAVVLGGLRIAIAIELRTFGARAGALSPQNAK